jgi:ABC-type transport system substrate-binding protein
MPAEAGPPKVNRLVIAVDPAAGETNLPWAGTVDHHQQFDLVMEVLVDIDPYSNTWVPELATDWTMSPDGMTFTYNLVEGVQFHDGWGEFTANDVKHTVERMTSDESILGYKAAWQLITDVEVVNDHQFKLHLKNPNPDYPFYLAPSGGGVIMSKAYWDAEGLEGYERDVIGTGPYRYTGREFGNNVTYERLDNHWRRGGSDGLPQPDWPEIEIKWIKEVFTRNAGLLEESIHITELTRELADAAVADQGMKILKSQFPGNTIEAVFGGLWNTEGSQSYAAADPFRDVKVRQAMNKAINKQELIDTLFSGRVSISPVCCYYPDLPGWNQRWIDEYDEKYGYDTEGAKALLAEAGYGPDNPLKIRGLSMQFFGFAEAVDLLQAMQIYFRDVGIDMALEEWEFNNFFAEWRVMDENQAGTVWAAPPSYKTVNTQLLLFHYAGEGGGPGRFLEDDWLDAEVGALQQMVDTSDRDAQQRKVGDYLFDNFATMSMFFIFIEFTANPDIVADWPFPGSDGANYGHFDLITACRTAEPCY